MALTAEEKERFLKAPYPPREFRYAVAGYLGVLEVLKRLDALGGEDGEARKGDGEAVEGAS